MYSHPKAFRAEYAAYYTTGRNKLQPTLTIKFDCIEITIPSCKLLGMAYSHKLDGKCSVSQAEIFVIMKAAELIQTIENEINEPVWIVKRLLKLLNLLQTILMKS